MEKLFAYFYKNNLHRESKKDGYLEIDNVQSELKVFANLISESDYDIDIGLSLWSCGFIGNELLIPIQCRWTKDAQLNLNLLKILIIKSIAIKHLNISFDFNDKSRIYPRLFTLSKMSSINQWIDSRFRCFKEFEQQTYDALQKHLTLDNLLKNKVFTYWEKQIRSRSNYYSPSFNEILKSIDYKEKINDIPHVYLHATIPLPMRKSIVNQKSSEQNTDLNNSTQKPKNRDRKEYVLNADSRDKQSVNPVTHSFEKMETLDDYSGGNRIMSGDDELNEHSSALDELEVNQYTTKGKASGIFRQDMQFIKNSETDIQQSSFDLTAKVYSEWNYKTNSYNKNYCQLYEISPDKKDNSGLKNEILTLNKNKITKWSQYYSTLLNKPLWLNRQIDGTELDLDNLIRLAPNIKTTSGNPRIYQKKEKLELEIHLSILIDISYSTDTWLNSQKIIDTIKESVVVFGESIKNLTNNISISLTYSQTRKNISYMSLLQFGDNWTTVYDKLHEFKSRQYTRLGPSIRHATKLLHFAKSKNPILIIITDGKPTDLDPYEGQYGQCDVKKSIEEAINLGIQPLLIGITDLNPVSLAKIAQNYINVSNADDFCFEVGKFITKIIRS